MRSPHSLPAREGGAIWDAEGTLAKTSLAGAAIFLAACILSAATASAQCTLTIDDATVSGWGKKSVSYKAEGNTLKVTSSAGAVNDADSLYIGSIKGCQTFVVTLVRVSGDFPWGGKVIGFSFSRDKLDPSQWGSLASFPPPRGRAMEAGLIEGRLTDGTQLVYDIANSAETTHIGAKVFVGGGVALDLTFGTRSEGSASIATSAAIAPASKPAFRPTKPFTPVMSRRQEAPAASTSCASACHQPRDGYGRSGYGGSGARMHAACQGYDDDGTEDEEFIRYNRAR